MTHDDHTLESAGIGLPTTSDLIMAAIRVRAEVDFSDLPSQTAAARTYQNDVRWLLRYIDEAGKRTVGWECPECGSSVLTYLPDFGSQRAR